MTTHILIVGRGPSGTLAANRLRLAYDGDGVEITVVDRSGPARDPEIELLTAIGLYGPGTLRAPEHRDLRDGIRPRHAEAVTLAPDREEATLTDGTALAYDILVVATGAPPPAQPRTGFAARAGLCDSRGYVVVDPHTQRSPARPRVFALGGATRLPTGRVAQAETLVRQVRAVLADAAGAAPNGDRWSAAGPA
ncbi:FAD-dependent oxidoreductase [Actinacidiphila acididurans]|uniref:FAD-dependent oxidoreductase n=1 Tax=Actinacidiphila acididurans TaxID=2784346 RepID=A0ABS2TP63_9ACTN|nr:FAD-dependent oxidoreductase [Actinacidiphila acididurans]MBM9504281.1 FAD-dependent oxidoreductase [Actinacidiphila acididurans]